MAPGQLPQESCCGLDSSDSVLDYDNQQEIARSAYADMLHDTERNVLYQAALESTIKRLKGEGKRIRVFDIGTGSGLLSIMAVRAGADEVFACDCFPAALECAKRVIADNGCSSSIHLIPRRSNEVQLEDLGGERCNICVAELFDTELIGEGALYSFNDAAARLLTKDAVVIPTAATVYIQLAVSPSLGSFNHLDVTPESRVCSGLASPFDLQLNQVHDDELTLLTKPMSIFSYDFIQQSPLHNSCSIAVPDYVNNLPHDMRDLVVLFWWDLQMDDEHILSLAPRWIHPHGRDSQWREHWLQAVYFPRLHDSLARHGPVKSLHIQCKQDPYSYSFNITATGHDIPTEMNACLCGTHSRVPRRKVALLNSKEYLVPSLPVIQARPILIEGDFALLQFKLSEYQQLQVINGTSDIIIASTKAPYNGNFDMLIDPYYSGAHLPWEHLEFIRTLNSLPRAPDRLNVKEVVFHMSAVRFDNLQKIRTPLGSDVCGVDLTSYDGMIQTAIANVDGQFEAHPLWEYPSAEVASAKSFLVMPVQETPLSHFSGSISWDGISPTAEANALVVWLDFVFVDGTHLSSGQQLNGDWSRFYQQGVWLWPTSRTMDHNSALNWELNLKELTFHCR